MDAKAYETSAGGQHQRMERVKSARCELVKMIMQVDYSKSELFKRDRAGGLCKSVQERAKARVHQTVRR